MKKILLGLTLLLNHNSNAQTSIETLVGNRQVHYLSYWQKDIDSLGKFNFFSLSRYAIDFKDKTYNNFAIDGQFTYQLKNWIGLSVGGGFAGEVFTPTIGLNLSYANKKGDFFIETYPTIELSEKKSFNFFGLCGYIPKFNNNWGLFSQLIFSTNLALDKTQQNSRRQILGLFTAHQQSTQLLRVGLNYREKLQFGFGLDLNQFYQNEGNFSNVGFFIRTAL
jgi:hypothetical protein